jgi:hypothetical protein
MPAPSVPLIKIRPVAASGQLTFYWAAPASDGGSAITSYTLTCDGRSDEVIADPATRVYTVTGLTNGTSYTFSLYASNADGAGPAATFRTVKPGAKASIVQDISANTLGENGAIIAWSAPANDGGASIGWYVVQSVSSNGADPVLKKSRRFYQTSCKLSGLNTASTYYFRVRAVNDPGYGPDASSNEISFDIADPANITYSNGGLTVTGYSGALNGRLTIPSGPTEIADAAFKNKTGLTQIVIPSGVTRIGDEAFSGCTALTSATIPSSATSIRYFAFLGCTSLASISIPGSANISPYAFTNCTSATSISIPNITSIGTEAFNNCRFTSVSIPSSVTGWDNSSFSGNPNLTTVTIGSGITAIPNYAFYGCANLSSVSLPASLTSIGGNAFRACTGLTSISIPSGVTSMGGSAFMETRLVSVVLPNCGTIGDECFKDIPTLVSVTFNSNNLIVGSQTFRYTNLVNVSMPNVTNIGSAAFANNSSLITVTAPNAVTIAANAFNDCPNLVSHP